MNKTKKTKWQLPYESRTHSQHGEDGIIKIMTDAITDPNRFVFEIGWGSGTENMSRALFEQGWSGIGIDGAREPHADLVVPDQFEYRGMYVDMHNLEDAFKGVPQDLDFFSLDIDSFDFEVARWALAQGYRPRTVCVEFNQGFGPSVQASFPWLEAAGRPKRVYDKHHCYGSSLAKYQALWTHHGYEFFTVDSSFVNAFFYDPAQVRLPAELPRLDQWALPSQQDNVLPVLELHGFWSQHLDQVYRSFSSVAPTDACDASTAPTPGPDSSSETVPVGAANDHDQT
jgi:hypothetical protein